jgi:hypothetical protein
MSCEECERLHDLQARTHRSYLEHIGGDPREAQPIDHERELKDAYDAAAAKYKGHLAAAQPLRSSF